MGKQSHVFLLTMKSFQIIIGLVIVDEIITRLLKVHTIHEPTYTSEYTRAYTNDTVKRFLNLFNRFN